MTTLFNVRLYINPEMGLRPKPLRKLVIFTLYILISEFGWRRRNCQSMATLHTNYIMSVSWRTGRRASLGNTLTEVEVLTTAISCSYTTRHVQCAKPQTPQMIVTTFQLILRENTSKNISNMLKHFK